jgi:peptidoglycan/LPS O-acetylase OafA/YrhL
LDGLRAVAATMVFVFHAYGHAGYPKLVLPLGSLSLNLVPAINFGSQGVTLFFVLSGFLLSLPFWAGVLGLSRSVEALPYLKRRFVRIYPAYFVAVIIYATLFDVNHEWPVRIAHVVSHMLLIHNLAEATIYNLAVPLWSVATEFQMYLILPIIFLVITALLKKGVKPGWQAVGLAVIFGLGGTIFYLLAVAVLKQVPIDTRLVAANGNVLIDSPLVGLAHFSAGIATGYFYIYFKHVWKRGLSPTLLNILTLLVVAALVVLALVNRDELGLPPTAWPFMSAAFAGLILLVSLQRSGIVRWLESGPIRFLGLVSYSFYLYHALILAWVYEYFPGFLRYTWLDNNPFKILLAYLLTTGVAWISYRFVEQFFLARLTPLKATTHSVEGLSPT